MKLRLEIRKGTKVMGCAPLLPLLFLLLCLIFLLLLFGIFVSYGIGILSATFSFSIKNFKSKRIDVTAEHRYFIWYLCTQHNFLSVYANV